MGRPIFIGVQLPPPLEERYTPDPFVEANKVFVSRIAMKLTVMPLSPVLDGCQVTPKSVDRNGPLSVPANIFVPTNRRNVGIPPRDVELSQVPPLFVDRRTP